MKKPTERQKEVLDFIAGYINIHTYPPTIREVADYFSISVKGAHDHLAALKKKGLLRQGDKRSRTMELVRTGEEGEGFAVIPILGTVAAGRPILSVENMDGSIKLHRSFIRNGGKYFALRVKGDSMEEAGIMNGDTAVIEQSETVRNGEIAVVMLDDDAVTLKRFYRENNRIKLQPENSKYSPIFCSRDVRVLGKLAHIIRSYG
ncbi:MAG: transcriptional repressor LexA [Treponema sp.]|jgi:repressor LexA|nr:transcriptional repressor LexA [Treponema sp.]